MNQSLHYTAVIVVLLTATLRAAGTVDFNRDIRPILSDKCYRCHGPDANQRQAELRLDDEAVAKADRGGQRAIVPGDPETSVLMARITAADDDQRMPPTETGKQLTVAEIELLRRWIAEGATWSQHWAYVRAAPRPAGQVKDRHWPRNYMDQYVLAEMEALDLRPAPQAETTTLIRRLYFDLIGLPPTPEQVAALGEQPTDNDYDQLVDQLLASPHFGERMAIYWLDLVRYADTVGYHGDQDHNISPYRDYVIDAFNDGMPFDQFTREQLSGDLLPGASFDQQIASGYNRLLQTSHEGGVQPKEYLAIYAADRVRNVSATWLGGTLGCAQCHDHKFDPYTSKDFYAMAAFFADIDEAEHFRVGSNELPTKRPPEIMVFGRRERERWERMERARLALKQELAQAADDQSAALRQQLTQLEARQRSLQMHKRMTMITMALSEPRATRILPRGNWLDESGPQVDPAVPQFLGSLSIEGRRATRLDLADWLTDPQQGIGGLTARVLANRLWYLLLGQGLSRSLEDFGAQGEPPQHVDLLDRLAVELLDSDWDIKHLVRLIVTSRTYRQASTANERTLQADGDNRWFTRQSRFRLPAEMVRDSALAVSGLLNREMGGVSARPYQPAGYYRHLNFPEREYQHDTDRQQWRRGVYVHWQRQYLHPTLRAMDAPTREECTTLRARSNTPLAALALLNDVSFVEAARKLAERVLLDSANDSDADRLNLALRLVLSRPADEFEHLELLRLLDQQRHEYQAQPAVANQLLTVGQSPANEQLDVVELAAWTSVARVLLNLHEAVTRN